MRRARGDRSAAGRMSGGAGHKLEMGGVERSCRLALRSAQRLADGGEIGVDRRLHRVLAAELLGAQPQDVGGERVMLHAAPGGKLAGQVDGGAGMALEGGRQVGRKRDGEGKSVTGRLDYG